MSNRIMIIKLIQLGQEVPTEQQIKDVFHNFHITRLEIVPPKVYVEFDDLEMVEFAYANGTIPELGGVEFVAAAHDFVWESIVKETTHIEKHPVPKLDKITSMQQDFRKATGGEEPQQPVSAPIYEQTTRFVLDFQSETEIKSAEESAKKKDSSAKKVEDQAKTEIPTFILETEKKEQSHQPHKEQQAKDQAEIQHQRRKQEENKMIEQLQMEKLQAEEIEKEVIKAKRDEEERRKKEEQLRLEQQERQKQQQQQARQAEKQRHIAEQALLKKKLEEEQKQKERIIAEEKAAKKKILEDEHIQKLKLMVQQEAKNKKRLQEEQKEEAAKRKLEDDLKQQQKRQQESRTEQKVLTEQIESNSQPRAQSGAKQSPKLIPAACFFTTCLLLWVIYILVI